MMCLANIPCAEKMKGIIIHSKTIPRIRKGIVFAVGIKAVSDDRKHKIGNVKIVAAKMIRKKNRKVCPI